MFLFGFFISPVLTTVASKAEKAKTNINTEEEKFVKSGTLRLLSNKSEFIKNRPTITKIKRVVTFVTANILLRIAEFLTPLKFTRARKEVTRIIVTALTNGSLKTL